MEGECNVKPSYREFMNFVALKDEIGKSNALVRTMIAMLNQPVDQNTRNQIVHWFQKIAKVV